MSGSVVGNLKIRLDFDSSQFERGMAQARRELSTYDRAVGMSTRIAKDNNFAMKDSSHALHNMKVAYQGNEQMVKKLTDANIKLKKEGDQSGKFEKNENAIRNYQMKMYDLNKEYEKLQTQMYTSNSVFTKSGKAMESVGGVIKTAGEGISQVGAGLTKAGLALTGTMGVFVKQAVDFEQGLAGVQKTTNASNEEMVVLEENIREMAKVMPIATNELLALGEQAGQLGIAQSDIAEFTEVMVMMGTATNLSAEEAGESFARFVNITGHGMEGLDKLGSTVVHLGNNFATTESEIMNLAMGLAGSLSTVGVAEADILGLSAGMSALGINAERGSSSMSKMFIEMAKDVQTGSGNLKKFAEVSGVTMKEFQQAFEKDAMGAMEMFIAGLGKMDDAGGNLLGTLEDMGINEIRLRDTILRLAGGHEVLSDAIKTSNEGYSEGTALQEEYDILAQTTASQIEIAKNKMKDMGLTIGQSLVPAFIDLMDNSDALIGSIEKGVDWFVNLDDTVKQNIVRFTAFALIGGPILSMFGNITSGIGGLIIAFGKANIGIGKFSGKLQTSLARGLGDTVLNATGATTSISALGEGAVVAGGPKGVGLLVKSLAGSAGLPWALGIAGVAIAGWAGWKLWGEGAYNANRQTKEWGTTLSEETEKVLSSVKTDIEEVSGKFGLMSSGFDADTQSMIGNMQNIGQTIQDDLNSRLEQTSEYLLGLPENLRNSQEEILEEHRKHLNETIGLVNENAEKVAEIEQRVRDENREATVAELAFIREYQTESMSAYLTTLGLSADEELAIKRTLAGEVESLTKEQAYNAFTMLKQENAKMQEERRKHVQETMEIIESEKLNPNTGLGKEMLDNVDRYWDALGISSERGMSEIVEMYPEIVDEMIIATGEMLSVGHRHHQEIVDANKTYTEGLEKSYRDVEEQAKATMDATATILSHSTEGAEEWNQVVANSGETVGEFKEKLAEATADIGVWNNIRPLVHSVDLDSNAKKIIGEVAIEQGRWDGMAWEDKEAVLKDNYSLTTYEAIVSNGTWANLEWEERIAILNNEFSGTTAEALINNGDWNKLDWEEQMAILTTNTPETLVQVLEDLGVWDNLDPEIRLLLADGTDVTKKVASATRELDDYGNIIVKEPELKVQNKVSDIVAQAQRDINQLQGKTVYINAVARAGGSASSKKFIESGGSMLERGTNFHRGGPAVVNDERSNRFRELVTLPSGYQFIPEGKNVMMDLPRGSKVLRASLTKRLFPDLPQYASGSGLQTTRVPRSFKENKPTQSRSSISGMQRELTRMARMLSNTQLQVQAQGPTINIGTIENYTEYDIPKILEEASWIMQGERGRLNG